MGPDVLLPTTTEPLRMWQFERLDGYVFQCDLTDTVGGWMLTLACNGLVFARHAFDSRADAQSWADDFLIRLTSRQHGASSSARGRAA